MAFRWLLGLLCLLTLPATLSAAEFQRPAGAAAIEEVTAGYQALFACSAHFVAGRPLSDILEVELVDMKPFALPPPQIDEKRRLVRARDQKGRVMIAAYRGTVGCTLLPPHWSEADVSRLPYVELPAAPDREQDPFPLGDLAAPNPSDRQRRVLSTAFDGSSYGDGTVTVGVVIVKDGEIVGEQYRQGFGIRRGYRTWSTAKSISATLIGIAVRDGLMKLEAPANVPEWSFFDDPRQRITVANLLHMSSGLYSQGSNTNAIYFGGQDVVSAATTNPLEATPNTRWQYANNDTLLALYALRTTLGDDLRYHRYPYDELFHRIGMHDTRMEMDHRGNFVGSSQVYTTARDLARFGLLYQQKGVWQGERILPEGWTEFVARPAPAKPRVAGERGYGAQFWLMDTVAGVPPGTYTTAGNKGQYVTILPNQRLVIVRTGVDPNGKRWQHDRFVAAVAAAYR